jgi:hypothetical protein
MQKKYWLLEQENFWKPVRWQLSLLLHVLNSRNCWFINEMTATWLFPILKALNWWNHNLRCQLSVQFLYWTQQICWTHPWEDSFLVGS